MKCVLTLLSYSAAQTSACKLQGLEPNSRAADEADYNAVAGPSTSWDVAVACFNRTAETPNSS